VYIRGGDKKDVRPIGDWDAVSTTDSTIITAWFTGRWRGTAYAIDCGKAGIVVADQDVTDGQDGPREWDALGQRSAVRVLTPTGGLHDYYKEDPDTREWVTTDNTGKVAPGVDIRGNGGFVFGPGSFDPRGGGWICEYSFLPPVAELEPVPRVVVDRMLEALKVKRPKAPKDDTPSAAPLLTQKESQLFGGGGDFGPGAGLKTREAAFELLRRETVAFQALTEPNNNRSKILSTNLGVLAGHGIEVFWTWDQAWDALMAACHENGFVMTHGEQYVALQLKRGLEYGARELWTPDMRPESDGAMVVSPQNLPDGFWTARPSLQLIRDKAHSRNRSADTVLAGTLAHYAATFPPGYGPDTGIGGGRVSLNFYAAVVGASGTGKTSGVGVAGRIVPTSLTVAKYPLGSGEGMCEAYMGTVDEEQAGSDGKIKHVKVRKKVHDHALFVQDEGQALVNVMTRQGSTVGETLRSCWSGATMGQQNGRAETTRRIEEETYSAGLVIGFQPEAAAPLFSDESVSLGMAQRFVWFSAQDSTIPDDAPEVPDEIRLTHPYNAWRDAESESQITRPQQKMELPAHILTRLRSEDLAVQRGEVIRRPLDSQKPLALIKLACLLALIDGRMDVTQDDWNLAEQVWASSDAIRARIQQGELERREAERKAGLIATTARARASREGEHEADGALEEKDVAATMRQLLTKLSEGPMAGSDLRKTVRSTRRKYFPAALERLLESGQLLAEGASYRLPEGSTE